MCGQKTNIGNVEKQSETPLVSEVGPAKKRKDARIRKNKHKAYAGIDGRSWR